jgi:hypothetical protein
LYMLRLCQMVVGEGTAKLIRYDLLQFILLWLISLANMTKVWGSQILVLRVRF